MSGEQFPGVDGPVGAWLVWDRDGAGPAPAVLLVAGSFAFAGATPAPGIAAWNGASWSSPFSSGFDGTVRALAEFNGEVIAAGEFQNAGGAPASHIARWNGFTWQPLGAGLDNSVYALAVYNGRLYAGGAFTSAGGVPAWAIARWDGASWSAVGVSGLDNVVLALSVFNNALYAGGTFMTADGLSSPGIAKWDDAAGGGAGAWGAAGTGVGPADVRTLLSDGSLLYAGGAFVAAGGHTAYGVAKWDGTTWQSAGQGLYTRTCVRYTCTNHPYKVNQLARFGSLIYAAVDPGGGAPSLFKFDGASWTAGGGFTATSVEPWPITMLTSFNGQLYVGGTFGGANAPQNIASLNGSQWRLVTGMDGPIVSLTPFGGGLVATGGFTQIEGAAMAHVAFWDGTAWHALGAGVGQYTSSAAVVGGDLYVAAWPGGIVHWDGTTWTTLYGAGAMGGPPAVGTWNNQVICGAPGAYFGAIGEGNASAAAAWDGASWVPLGELGSVAVGPSAFANLNGALYVAGSPVDGGAPVARWQGGADWSGVGDTSLGAYSRAVAVNKGVLYTSLYANDGSGVVARLVGSSWQQLGDSFDIPPSSLASANGNLYAVGTFTVVGATACDGIAMWNGVAWQPVGSGASGAVQTVAGLNGKLVAGGAFTGMGGRGWSSFAVYDCRPPAPCPGDLNGDGLVNTVDLGALLGHVGQAVAPGSGGDLNGDGVVNTLDLAAMLTNFGVSCP